MHISPSTFTNMHTSGHMHMTLRKQGLGYTRASNPHFVMRRRFQKLYSDFKSGRCFFFGCFFFAFKSAGGVYARWPIGRCSAVHQRGFLCIQCSVLTARAVPLRTTQIGMGGAWCS